MVTFIAFLIYGALSESFDTSEIDQTSDWRSTIIYYIYNNIFYYLGIFQMEYGFEIALIIALTLQLLLTIILIAYTGFKVKLLSKMLIVSFYYYFIKILK